MFYFKYPLPYGLLNLVDQNCLRTSAASLNEANNRKTNIFYFFENLPLPSTNSMRLYEQDDRRRKRNKQLTFTHGSLVYLFFFVFKQNKEANSAKHACVI